MVLGGVNYRNNSPLEQNYCSSLNKWLVLMHSKNRWNRVSSFVLQKEQRGEEIFPNLKSILFT